MDKKHIVILSGAGVSAESGLMTYRDNGGLWDNFEPMEVASIDGWRRNSEMVLGFYNGLRKRIEACLPNQAHVLIAGLENDYDVDVITQNVDDLHERAGSTKVVHLHGEASKVRPEYGEYDRSYSESEVRYVGYEPVNPGDKTEDGRQLRPHIVFFGEAVPKIGEAARLMAAADIVLIVGTSLQVYPAAGLVAYAPSSARIFLVDPADVPISNSRITHIKEAATTGVAKFCEMIKSFSPAQPL